MKTIDYVRPGNVHSPQKHWTLVHVLFDGGPAKRDGTGTSSSLAIGRWDNRPVLAMRWNGDENAPLGNPQSRGLATWFIVPDQHVRQILETEPYAISATKMKFARDFLESRHEYFFAHCPTPSCQNFRNLVLANFRPDEIDERIADLEGNELRFYCIYCDQQWPPTPDEKARLLKVFTDAKERQLQAQG